jgi:hypothetical protein
VLFGHHFAAIAGAALVGPVLAAQIPAGTPDPGGSCSPARFRTWSCFLSTWRMDARWRYDPLEPGPGPRAIASIASC